MVAIVLTASYFSNMKTFKDMLSTRSKNGLVGCFGDSDIIYQPERIAAGRDKLTLARNIGVVGLMEFMQRGCIN
jgi:hypothetical protein